MTVINAVSTPQEVYDECMKLDSSNVVSEEVLDTISGEMVKMVYIKFPPQLSTGLTAFFMDKVVNEKIAIHLLSLMIPADFLKEAIISQINPLEIWSKYLCNLNSLEFTHPVDKKIANIVVNTPEMHKLVWILSV
jgi:hypothetical protein